MTQTKVITSTYPSEGNSIYISIEFSDPSKAKMIATVCEAFKDALTTEFFTKKEEKEEVNDTVYRRY